MLILHTRRNTTYQCTEITDIIHGVFNSGCAYYIKKGVHVLDECPVIHLLGTCAHALSEGQDMSTWKWVLWNLHKIIRKCTSFVRWRCIYLITGLHSKHVDMNKNVSIIWPNYFPKQPWCKGFLCQKVGPKTIGCHPHHWSVRLSHFHWVQIQCRPVRPMQLWRIV